MKGTGRGRPDPWEELSRLCGHRLGSGLLGWHGSAVQVPRIGSSGRAGEGHEGTDDCQREQDAVQLMKARAHVQRVRRRVERKSPGVR